MRRQPGGLGSTLDSLVFRSRLVNEKDVESVAAFVDSESNKVESIRQPQSPVRSHIDLLLGIAPGIELNATVERLVRPLAPIGEIKGSVRARRGRWHGRKDASFVQRLEDRSMTEDQGRVDAERESRVGGRGPGNERDRFEVCSPHARASVT